MTGKNYFVNSLDRSRILDYEVTLGEKFHPLSDLLF